MVCPKCGSEMVIDSWNGWVWTCLNCDYVGRFATNEEVDMLEKYISDFEMHGICADCANFCLDCAKGCKDASFFVGKNSNPKRKIFDLKFYLVRQRLWYLSVFGPGQRDAGLIKHIKKELDEIQDSPGDIEEWIDVIILAFEGALRNARSVDPVEDVIDCLQKKQDKNLARTWPDWVKQDPEEPIEHVKNG